MPRRTLQKWMPSPDHIRQLPGLNRFGHWLHEPGIWHLNRRSVARAFAIGLFLALLPIPGQMPLAALAAIFFTANLPIALSLVWLTNPFTMPVIFYGTYWLGARLSGRSVIAFETLQQNGWGSTLLLDIYWPTFLGGGLCGLLLAPLGYAAMSGLYHWRVRLNRRRRDRLRQQRRNSKLG